MEVQSRLFDRKCKLEQQVGIDICLVECLISRPVRVGCNGDSGELFWSSKSCSCTSVFAREE